VESSLTISEKLPVTIIGAGAVGGALAYALRKKHYPLRLILSKHGKSARALGRRVHALHARMSEAHRFDLSGIIFVAVPDDELEDIARLLLHRRGDFSHVVIFHTSGALTSDVFLPVRRKGAAVGSFHPLQTFPKSGSPAGRFRGIWVGLEGDTKAVKAGKRIASDLGARPFVLSPSQKTLYHIAAVFSSNYFVTLLSVVEALGKQIRLPRKSIVAMVEPLVLQSLANVEKYSAASALTGPIARGDIKTVQRHRNELRKKRLHRIARLYSTLAEETHRLALRKKN
jgi:predicted short-subunit dehydrogenase-like oxidoreductase (DUF2520 family)